MRGSRLLSILMLLQLRGRMTADALAAEFEVSTRTIYRDVDHLSAAGVPVYGDRGPGGGIALLDGYRTNLTGLSADEAEAMFMIGMPGPAAALGLGPAAARAGDKLLAALPGTASRGAERISARFHLDPVEWYRADEPAIHLPGIARAVLDQRVVSMRYGSWTGVRSWRVEPLGLVQKAGAWYVVARSGNTTRIFKVAGILAQTVLDATFERPDAFDLATFWSTAIKRFETGLRAETASLRVSPAGLKRLVQLGAYAAKAVNEADPPDAKGWVRVRLPVENVEQAALLVLGLGPEVEVLAPSAVRERVSAHAAALVRLNRGTRTTTRPTVVAANAGNARNAGSLSGRRAVRATRT